MARERTHRLKIKGTLEATQPLHVGGMGDGVETDMPLACDGQGRFYIPGTSLAGPMRAWIQDDFDDGQRLANQVFGFQEPNNEQGHASYALVEDAPVHLPDGLDQEIWDGVGIDRQWGVAAEGIKYDRAILPKGTRFDLGMAVEIPPADSKASAGMADPCEMRSVVGHLLEALVTGKLAFGAARTRGLGNVTLEPDSLQIQEEDWTSRTGVLTLLGGSLPTLSVDDLKKASLETIPQSRRIVRLRIGWKPDGPVMIKAGYDGVAVDMLPMVSGVEPNQVTMVLPGSSLKGALRSQAERIIRTLFGRDRQPQWNQSNARQRHLAQVDEPLVAELFGLAKRAIGKKGKVGNTAEVADSRSTNRKGHRGALQISTCYARNVRLDPDQWQTIAGAQSDQGQQRPDRSPLYEAIDQAGLHQSAPPGTRPYLQQAYHVAVDRWTGGAAEGFLYSTLEPFNIAWDEIILTLDLDFLSRRVADPDKNEFKEQEFQQKQQSAQQQREKLCKAAVVLLLLLARDLVNSRIPIGFAGNRGCGSIRVQHLYLEVEGNIAWLKSARLDIPGANHEVSPDPAQVQEAWNRWSRDSQAILLQDTWSEWITKNEMKESESAS